MMRNKLALAILTSATIAVAMPAFAQGIEIGRGGVRVVPDRPPPDYERRDRRDRDFIGRRAAIRIARSEGLRDVDNVHEGRHSYVVDGTDRRGRDISVRIDAFTGQVLSVR